MRISLRDFLIELVEVAGIEPASCGSVADISTCLVEFNPAKSGAFKARVKTQQKFRAFSLLISNP